MIVDAHSQNVSDLILTELTAFRVAKEYDNANLNSFIIGKKDSILPAFNHGVLVIWCRGNYLLFMAMNQISGWCSILQFKWGQGSPQDLSLVQNDVSCIDMFLGYSVGQCLPYNKAEAKCPLQWGIWESYILFCTGTDYINLFILYRYRLY